jgi:hypothetical protein
MDSNSPTCQIDQIAARVSGGLIDKPTALKQIRVILALTDPATIVLAYALQHQTDMATNQTLQMNVSQMATQHLTDTSSMQSLNSNRVVLESALTNLQRIIGQVLGPT